MIGIVLVLSVWLCVIAYQLSEIKRVLKVISNRLTTRSEDD